MPSISSFTTPSSSTSHSDAMNTRWRWLTIWLIVVGIIIFILIIILFAVMNHQHADMINRIQNLTGTVDTLSNSSVQTFTPVFSTSTDLVTVSTDPADTQGWTLYLRFSSSSSCRIAWIKTKLSWKQDQCHENMDLGHVVVDISKAQFVTIQSFWGFVQNVTNNPYQYIVGDGSSSQDKTKTVAFRLSRNGCSPAVDSCQIALLVIGT